MIRPYGDIRSTGRLLDDKELAERKRLFALARRVDEQAAAHLRDEYRLRTLVLDGQAVMTEGVLWVVRMEE